MAMSHRDRYKLKSQLVEAFELTEWTRTKTNLLFDEFGIERLDDHFQGPFVGGTLSNVSDSTLVGLYSTVFEVREEEVAGAIETIDGTSNWKSGYVRLFLSHSATEKDFIGQVASELEVVGIHGFVAHDAMEYSKPWQEQIEAALRSMQAFVAFAHPDFNGSAWCHQEVGWALGRRVPRYVIRLGADPGGFIGREQWPAGLGWEPREVARQIYAWVAGLPELGSSIVDGLLKALSEAGNYESAGAACKRVVSLGSLSNEDFTRLNQIYWANDQIHDGILAKRQLQPFYLQHDRAWPPPNP